MDATMDFSTGSENRISVVYTGWPERHKELLSTAVAPLQGVTKLASAGGGTSLYVYFDPEIVSSQSLQAQIDAIANSLMQTVNDVVATATSVESGPFEWTEYTDPDETPEASANSADWTGRYIVSAEGQVKVVGILRDIDQEIEASSLTNSDKVNAKALIRAAEILIEAPDPQWDIILKILSSPILANFVALAALIATIVK